MKKSGSCIPWPIRFVIVGWTMFFLVGLLGASTGMPLPPASKDAPILVIAAAFGIFGCLVVVAITTVFWLAILSMHWAMHGDFDI